MIIQSYCVTSTFKNMALTVPAYITGIFAWALLLFFTFVMSYVAIIEFRTLVANYARIAKNYERKNTHYY